MDPNANANVPAPQPNPATPAGETANGTNPVPAPAPAPAEPAKEGSAKTDPVADGTSSQQADSGFDPEVQKYLENQNISTTDLKAAVSELVKRNQKLRGGQKTEPDQMTQEVAKVLNPEPAKPAEQVQAASGNPQPQPTPTSQPRNLTDMEIASVSLIVKQQFPDVTANADFYKSMIADGFKPTADGQINLKSVLNYAAYRQKLSDAEKAIAANQPKAGDLPQPSNAPEYAQVDKVQTMTEQAAQNIVMFSNQEKRYGRPIHPQYDEAVKFLQDQVRSSK